MVKLTTNTDTRKRINYPNYKLETDRNKNKTHNITIRSIKNPEKTSSSAKSHVTWPKATTIDPASKNHPANKPNKGK
ncbi:MAG: hypothetical protein BTN85_1619 [Candidatus Methanohalarchaeum thermophilum]|uniref:Uncharacterized protein n=1 Tax=Methanohalarchaeum thermophilum TaxID=1903181 RepID=A0A1Q6DXM9_METT1|nr:MAG: hypothetical protein BTN85_1619 [Candidatus Methanohalarchaeum thermophilum]